MQEGAGAGRVSEFYPLSSGETLDRIGAAIAREIIPSATSRGVHRLVVIGPDGTRNQWSVLVTG